MLVKSLLVEHLGFEQVGHLAGACTIVVTVQAKVLFGLPDATLCDGELLLGLNDTVAGVLHTNLLQLGIVGELLLGFLLLNLAALDGMGAAPPVGDGDADGGIDHTESAIVL